jgi:hypothetical protein
MYCIILTNAYYHGKTRLSSGFQVKPQEPVPTIGAFRGAKPLCVSSFPQGGDGLGVEYEVAETTQRFAATTKRGHPRTNMDSRFPGGDI